MAHQIALGGELAMEEATDLSQDNDDVMSELYGVDRWGIRVQTNVLMTDITTENGHVLMNVVTPALNGIDININGAALCTFLPSFSVRTDMEKVTVASSNCANAP